MINYQQAWEWLIENRNAPFTTVVYVASVTLTVKVKNLFTDKKHEVMVEVYKLGQEAPFTSFFMPRICITAIKTFEESLSNLLENALA